MLIVTFLLFVWTVSCWFTQGMEQPFLGLWILSIDVLIPFIVLIAWSIVALVLWFRRNGRNDFKRVGIWFSANKRTVIILGLIASLFMILQIPAIVMYRGANDSDNAMFGLEGYHIADGSSRPMWFYGKHFNGTFSPHLTAIFNKLFGKHPSFMHLVNSLLYLGFIIALFATVRRIAGEKPALLAAFLAAIPPYTIHFLINNGYTQSVLFWGGISLYLLVRMLEAERPTWRQYFWFGVAVGIGFWAHIQLIFFLVTGLIALFIRNKRYLFRPQIALLPAGFVLGSIVTFIDSFYYDWIIFRHFFGQASNPAGLLTKFVRGANEFVQHLPTMLGLRRELGHVDLYSPILSWSFFIVFIAILAYFVYLNREKLRDVILLRNVNPGPVVFLIFFAVVFLLFSVSNQAHPPSPARYIAPLWVAIVPIIAIVLVNVGTRIRSAGIAGISIFAVLFIVSNVTYDFRIAAREKVLLHWEQFCRENNITRYFGDFWQTYIGNFSTREEIIGTCVISHFFEAYPPYYYAVDDFPGKPAYHFLQPKDKWDTRLAVFEARLRGVGVTARKTEGEFGTFFTDFSERVTEKQISNLMMRKYEASIEGYENVDVGGLIDDDNLKIITFEVLNSGDAYWRASGKTGFVELVLFGNGGKEIRRQALTIDVEAGESVLFRTAMETDESRGGYIGAEIRVNDFVINKDKKRFRLSLDESGGAVNASRLGILRNRDAEDDYDTDDYSYFSGWAVSKLKGGRLLRWGVGSESTLGFILKRPRPIRLLMNVLPFRTERIYQTVGMAVSCNGTDLDETYSIDERQQLIVDIPRRYLRSGINRLVFRFDNAEPEYERIEKGDVFLRFRPKAVAFAKIKFRRFAGTADER